jgi:hypothetical protein
LTAPQRAHVFVSISAVQKKSVTQPATLKAEEHEENF